MARITFSPLIAGASGKAADAVFSRWKSTSYVRKHVIPANPQTAAQTLMRDAMGRIPYMWRKLRAAVQDAQDRYATNIGMSGYNWFAKQNAKLEKTFQAANITPPDVAVEPVLTFTKVDGGAGSVTFNWTGGSTGALIYATLWTRKITTAEQETSFTEQSWETVLCSAGTMVKALVALKKYTAVLSVWNKNTSKFSVSSSQEFTLGA